MKLAAGILFVARDTKRALFLKKGDNSDPPGEWGFPWGHADDDETMLQTAVREAVEEAGPDTPVEPEKCILWTRRQGNNIDGTCFLQYVDHEFEPSISDEHIGAGWFPIKEPPTPIHPGCAIALRKFTMDELDIAKAIRDGELVSPQKYVNVWLFDIRITGTGQAFRNEHNEHVWRPPEEYLNEEFLERCQGLAVVWVHPESAVLNSKEYGNRSIGSIMLPYIKNDEVWGIAKIYDEAAATEMRDSETSTSPGVMGVGNNKATMEDGSNVLIETKPRLLDHLAVMAGLGVWDKDGEMRGVARTDAQSDVPAEHNPTTLVDNNGDHEMSEAETKTAEGEEAGKRADASAGGEHPDKLLSRLDAATKTMSDMAEKLDAMEKERADRQAKKDAKKALKARHDELRARCDSGEASEEEKAEFAKMESERADKKAKKDGNSAAAEAAHEAEGAAHEAEGEAMKDAVRMDAQLGELRTLVEQQAKTIQELTTRTAPISDEALGQMAELQARCDSVAQLHGTSAPRPLAGETPLAYRKRLIKPFIKHSPVWSSAGIETLAALPEKAFAPIEAQIYADAARAAKDPTAVPAGVLRPMTIQQGGHTIITYHGSPSAWMDSFSGPTRQRVTGSFKVGSTH